MPLQYFEKWVHNHHTDSVDCIGFSQDGVFLASGSMDGTIIICDAASGTALHIIHCRSGVLALKWAPVRLHEVWCGLGDGRLLCIIIGKVIRFMIYLNGSNALTVDQRPRSKHCVFVLMTTPLNILHLIVQV